MGKPKKGKKGRYDDEFGDDDVDLDPLAQPEEEPLSAKPATKTKKGKKKKTDDWEDDVASEIAELSLEQNKGETGMNGEMEDVPQPKSKKKEKKKSKLDFDSEEEDLDNKDYAKTALRQKPAGFAALEAEGEDSPKEEMSDNEVVPVKNTNTDKSSQPKKKGKKEKKKRKEEDEDIDAILAAIEQKQAPEKGIDLKDMSSMTQEEIAKVLEAEYDEEEDDRKKKKKGKKTTEPAKDQSDDEAEDDQEDGGTVKTAAQKKKEKKERQKQKKLEEKSKMKNKKSSVEKVGMEKSESVEGVSRSDSIEVSDGMPRSDSMEVSDGTSSYAVKVEDGVSGLEVMDRLSRSESMEVKEEAETGDQAEDKKTEEESEKKKKKKDRKKKKDKDEEPKEETKKKPSKMAKMIQEQQRKIQEEEERIRKEMEEKERKLEEARKAREEMEAKAREKKEKEKQKKREKIEKQKKEGTFLTAKQKEAQRRAQQMLEALGITPGEEPVKKKRPVYDNKKKKKPQTQSSVDQKEPEAETPQEEQSVVLEMNETKVSPSVSEGGDKEEVKDAEDDDVKDAWDADSDTEVTEQVEESRVSESSSKKSEEEEKSEEEASEEEESSDSESSDQDSSDEESSSEDEMTAAEKSRNKALSRIKSRKEAAEKKVSTDVLRAAVVVVLGHVDTGKTKILDKLRRTNVQDNEAGGITQQIGATNVPVEAIKDSTKMCKEFAKQELKLPGLLIIDTPGHESFGNLRSRGSSLCDIAILVVDIMHGLEPQTIESINLLKERKTPFVVALNKIDRLYGWQANSHSDVVNVIKKQKENTKLEFKERADQVIVQFAEQGLNAKLFYENKNPKEYISLVPTSAHSGDGMGNLVALICELSQTHLAKKLAYSEELHATVMEVKALPGLGTTIDVILVNGKIHEGDTIIVPGTEGPIVTQVRGLLMPQPMKELRVKNAYEHHKEVKAAQGVKIIAKDLDHSLAGLPLYIAQYADEIDIYKEDLKNALDEILSSIKLQEKGVFVQASTLGSLEALLQFLRDSKIPYAGINIGPVHKRDVMKLSVMLDRDPQYAVLLAFDVKVEREAQDLADNLGIRVFTAEIIYHLFDSFMAYRDEYKKSKQDEFKHVAVFPCKLRVLPQCIFNSRDPIVLGVTVEAGFVKMGTPICVPTKENISLGHVTSIEINHKQIDKATKGQEVCIKIENLPGETPKLYGRHFDYNDLLVSKISRDSIDAVKNYFRDEMTKNDWQLVLELKKLFQIM